MGCGACRKPRVIRTPSPASSSKGSIVPKPSGGTIRRTTGSGDQRSRITGLTYVPK